MAEPNIEIFRPVTRPAPDWSAAGNWSGGIVPGAGMTAEITGLTAAIDPGVTIDAKVDLDGEAAPAALLGNGGAIALGGGASLAITGAAALYGCDSIVSQGIITLGDGATLDVVVELGALSGLTGAPPPSFANDGVIALGAGGVLEIGGTLFENTGLIDLEAGTLDVEGGAVAGGGTIDLAAGATARFGDGFAAQTVSFGPDGGTLVLEDPRLGPDVTVVDIEPGDTIALPTLADARIEQENGIVRIYDRTGTDEGSFTLASHARLALVPSGNGSAIVAATGMPAADTDPPCFAHGTMILTPTGYRRVEALAVGDPVVTAAGSIQPVVWTGWRALDLAVHPAASKVKPIRIAAEALGPGAPRRALRVSPDHSLWFDGVLIPAKLLVNDATISQEHHRLAVIYHHVELARHDLLIAEGVACESYLDTGNRSGFRHASAWPVRNRRWDRDACAPLCTGGARLRAVRERLHARALSMGFALEHASSVALWVDGVALPASPGAWLTLPARHSGRAVIRSARFVPASIDPASDDRRVLGVALAGVRTWRRLIAANHLALGGFHQPADNDRSIWTDGAGTIRLPARARRIQLDYAGLPVLWRQAGGRAPGP